MSKVNKPVGMIVSVPHANIDSSWVRAKFIQSPVEQADKDTQALIDQIRKEREDG